MASDEEDDDLHVLRTAVLASMKAKLKQREKAAKSGSPAPQDDIEDDPELAALRTVALMSKTKNEEKQTQQAAEAAVKAATFPQLFPQRPPPPFQQHYGPRHHMRGPWRPPGIRPGPPWRHNHPGGGPPWMRGGGPMPPQCPPPPQTPWGAPPGRSNLIHIQPVNLDAAGNPVVPPPPPPMGAQYPAAPKAPPARSALFRPQDKHMAGSGPPPTAKPKATGKFSRYEDSDSEEEEEEEELPAKSPDHDSQSELSEAEDSGKVHESGDEKVKEGEEEMKKEDTEGKESENKTKAKPGSGSSSGSSSSSSSDSDSGSDSDSSSSSNSSTSSHKSASAGKKQKKSAETSSSKTAAKAADTDSLEKEKSGELPVTGSGTRAGSASPRDKKHGDKSRAGDGRGNVVNGKGDNRGSDKHPRKRTGEKQLAGKEEIGSQSTTHLRDGSRSPEGSRRDKTDRGRKRSRSRSKTDSKIASERCDNKSRRTDSRNTSVDRDSVRKTGGSSRDRNGGSSKGGERERKGGSERGGESSKRQRRPSTESTDSSIRVKPRDTDRHRDSKGRERGAKGHETETKKVSDKTRDKDSEGKVSREGSRDRLKPRHSEREDRGRKGRDVGDNRGDNRHSSGRNRADGNAKKSEKSEHRTTPPSREERDKRRKEEKVEQIISAHKKSTGHSDSGTKQTKQTNQTSKAKLSQAKAHGLIHSSDSSFDEEEAEAEKPSSPIPSTEKKTATVIEPRAVEESDSDSQDEGGRSKHQKSERNAADIERERRMRREAEREAERENRRRKHTHTDKHSDRDKNRDRDAKLDQTRDRDAKLDQTRDRDAKFNQNRDRDAKFNQNRDRDAKFNQNRDKDAKLDKSCDIDTKLDQLYDRDAIKIGKHRDRDSRLDKNLDKDARLDRNYDTDAKSGSIKSVVDKKDVVKSGYLKSGSDKTGYVKSDSDKGEKSDNTAFTSRPTADSDNKHKKDRISDREKGRKDKVLKPSEPMNQSESSEDEETAKVKGSKVHSLVKVRAEKVPVKSDVITKPGKSLEAVEETDTWEVEENSTASPPSQQPAGNQTTPEELKDKSISTLSDAKKAEIMKEIEKIDKKLALKSTAGGATSGKNVHRKEHSNTLKRVARQSPEADGGGDPHFSITFNTEVKRERSHGHKKKSKRRRKHSERSPGLPDNSTEDHSNKSVHERLFNTTQEMEDFYEPPADPSRPRKPIHERLGRYVDPQPPPPRGYVDPQSPPPRGKHGKKAAKHSRKHASRKVVTVNGSGLNSADLADGYSLEDGDEAGDLRYMLSRRKNKSQVQETGVAREVTIYDDDLFSAEGREVNQLYAKRRSKKKSDKSRSRKHTEPSDQDAPAKKVKVVTSPDSKDPEFEANLDARIHNLHQRNTVRLAKFKTVMAEKQKFSLK